MSIVEFDEPPSWSHDASETAEYKMPVDRGGDVELNRSTSTISGKNKGL